MFTFSSDLFLTSFLFFMLFSLSSFLFWHDFLFFIKDLGFLKFWCLFLFFSVTFFSATYSFLFTELKMRLSDIWMTTFRYYFWNKQKQVFVLYSPRITARKDDLEQRKKRNNCSKWQLQSLDGLKLMTLLHGPTILQLFCQGTIYEFSRNYIILSGHNLDFKKYNLTGR